MNINAAKAFGAHAKPAKNFPHKKGEDGLHVGKNQNTSAVKNTGGLSEKAQSYLAKLKEKFGNVDFIIKDYSGTEEANQHLAKGTGEYNCIITPDLLEKMAADEEVAAKYEGIIEGAGAQLDELKQSIEKSSPEAAKNIKSYGFSVDGDGKVDLYVMLKESMAKLNDNTKEDLQAKRAGDKPEPKTRPEQVNMVKASTVEALLEKLNELDWSKYTGGKKNDKHDHAHNHGDKSAANAPGQLPEMKLFRRFQNPALMYTGKGQPIITTPTRRDGFGDAKVMRPGEYENSKYAQQHGKDGGIYGKPGSHKLPNDHHHGHEVHKMPHGRSLKHPGIIKLGEVVRDAPQAPAGNAQNGHGSKHGKGHGDIDFRG